MNIAELRSDLHRMIDEISDDRLLSAVKSFLSRQKNGDSDWWDELGTEEKESIQRGLEEANRGELIPHEEVMKQLKSKYNLD
jgi:predicted transcriptional regulator